MKHSKLSNNPAASIMKHLLVMALAMLIVSCGEEEQNKEQENSESNPKEETKELPPLPKTVTAEFIMGLWAKPHDERNLIEELKDHPKPGIWKVIRNIGPSEENQVQRIESSFTLKSVDQRFSVWQFSHDDGVQYSMVTYDFETESYRWWELLPDGFINEFSGKRYLRDLVEWKSVRLPEKDVQMRMRETDRGEKSFKATIEFKKGGELVAYAEDEATWLRKLEPQEKTREEK